MRDPAAIPIALSDEPQKPSNAAPIDEERGTKLVRSSASVHSPSPPSHISAKQLDQIDASLSSEARAVLMLLSEVRLATGHQLARRLWSSAAPTDSRARLARQTLGRLEQWRVIDRLPQRIGGVRGGSSSIVYSLGPSGRRLLTRIGFQSKRMRTPGDRYVDHHLAATEICVRLFEAEMAGELDVIELQTEPRCWRGFVGLMGGKQVVKPDLFVRIGAGALEDRWFIEIDRATESLPTIVHKAKVYLAHYRSGDEQRRHDVYPRVIWAVPDRRRAEQVSGVVASLPPGSQRLFVTWLYDEVTGRLAAEATS